MSRQSWWLLALWPSVALAGEGTIVQDAFAALAWMAVLIVALLVVVIWYIPNLFTKNKRSQDNVRAALIVVLFTLMVMLFWGL